MSHTQLPRNTRGRRREKRSYSIDPCPTSSGLDPQLARHRKRLGVTTVAPGYLLLETLRLLTSTFYPFQRYWESLWFLPHTPARPRLSVYPAACPQMRPARQRSQTDRQRIENTSRAIKTVHTLPSRRQRLSEYSIVVARRLTESRLKSLPADVEPHSAAKKSFQRPL